MASDAERNRIAQKYEVLKNVLNERQLRAWAGAEALALGHGGIKAVVDATGMGKRTIWTSKQEITTGTYLEEPGRVRRRGAGRPRKDETNPKLVEDLDLLIEPATRGDPMSPLRWTSKSTRNLADALNEMGHDVGRGTVAKILTGLGYSLQSSQKQTEGSQHPDRNAQFEYINEQCLDFQSLGLPVISVDTKKKELVGEFKNDGREWTPKGEPEIVRAHDFPSDAIGKAIPYGIYDIFHNDGWVNVGIDHDTAQFAAHSIHTWWQRMGVQRYGDAGELLIVADAGGSNSPRTRLWKTSVQSLADKTGLKIHVCHFPPGTSKWNKIEHRMFCHITENWRGRPLTSYELMVNLIGNTKTRSGLAIGASLDKGSYPTGLKVSEQELAEVRIVRDDWHGDWNYAIEPRQSNLQ